VNCWPAQMKSLFDVSGGYQHLHSGCLARFPGEPWKCLYPENYADLLKSRVLALNSFYDSSEMSYTLRLSCCPGGCGGRAQACAGRDLKLFQGMKEDHRKAWAPLARKNGSGVWSPSCIAHTMTCESWTDPAWEVPAGSGNTMAAVVARWLAGDDADSRHFVYEDPEPWPDNRPCAR